MGTFAPSYFFASVNIRPPPREISLLYYSVGLTTANERVDHLVSYVRDTRITSRLWPPVAWSAFMSSVRTNNNVKGWHNRLNHQMHHGHLDVYQLALVLHDEAQFVSFQAVLVSKRRLR